MHQISLKLLTVDDGVVVRPFFSIMKKSLQLSTAALLTSFMAIAQTSSQDSFISFADAEVKRICVENWDTNGDGELSYAEAAAVETIGSVFGLSNIKTFDEFRFFTSVKDIPNNAFHQRNLKSIHLPKSILSIGQEAFARCHDLTSVVLNEGLVSISDCAFLHCTKLKSVVIPSTVSSIIRNPFMGCKELESIVVSPENQTYDCRDNCNAIIETSTNKMISGCFMSTIPNTVTTIGNNAFWGCENLISIVIPEGVTTIGGLAFAYCEKLKTLYISKTVVDIEVQSIFECGNLESIIVDSENPVYDSRDNCQALIETKSNKLLLGCVNTVIPDVTEVFDQAFLSCQSLKSLFFPEGVTILGNQVVWNCVNLSEVILPSTLTSIGKGAFDECPNIVVVRSKMERPVKLNPSCFSNRTNATLYVPYGSKAAYEAVDVWKDFKEIIEMEPDPDATIDFSDAEAKRICVENWDTNGDGELSYAEAAAVTKLGAALHYADMKTFDEFQYFTGLATIDGDDFLSCSSLEEVSIPHSVTKLSFLAFQNCNALRRIVIPSSVIKIDDTPEANPFVGCRNLEEITVESGNPVYESPYGCNAIIKTATSALICGCKNTIIPLGVESIEGGAFNRSGLASITIPNTVKKIGFRSFDGCNLRVMDIPVGVTEIAENAFLACVDLNYVRIPASVSKIGSRAFSDCTKLTTVIANMEMPIKIEENVFTNRANATLYVPKGCKAAYAAADYWKEFWSIVEIDVDAPAAKGDLNGDGIVGQHDVACLINKILGFDEVREAYDVNEDGRVDISDVTCLIGIIGANQQSSFAHYCPDNHHPHMIDLGLPSGTKWACCNIGASKPEDTGSYYAWGETEEKSDYSWASYIHCDGTQESCHFLGDISGTEYDVAHVKWGGEWHMPSNMAMTELSENCTCQSDFLNGVRGEFFTGKNGHSIFIPVSGNSVSGYYWTSTPSDNSDRSFMNFVPNYGFSYRNNGRHVRPIANQSIFSPLILDTSALDIILDNERNVEVLSGSLILEIKSSNENVATASVKGNMVTVSAISIGDAIITVIDTRSGQTAAINVKVVPSITNCPDNHHPHIIDLGLPSGVKWACCNVGATGPEMNGGFYAWGETEEKEWYQRKTYLHYDADKEIYPGLGNITGTNYDVAHVKWGGAWRMPTVAERDELINNCSVETINYEYRVLDKFTGSNGNSIFLPYAGDKWGKGITEEGQHLKYWVSETEPSNEFASMLYGHGSEGFAICYMGLPVRPVYDPSFLSLSDETVDMFVNGSSSVTIEMGSGKYVLQCDHPEIVEAELMIADKEETPDAKDEIEIFGVAEGTATVTLVDTKTNKTATLVVNVKTPTAEDIENTKNYIAKIRTFIDQQGEMSIVVFKNNLFSWLNEQEWVKHTNLSLDKNQITTIFENGADFLFVFQDMSFFEKSEESQNSRLSAPWRVDTDERSFDVSFQEGEVIIREKNKILYFNCLNNYWFDLDEYNGIMKETVSSPVLIEVVKEDNDITKFIRNDYSDYGIVMISNTHGARNGSFIVGIDKKLEIHIGGFLICPLGMIINKFLPKEIRRITPKGLKEQCIGDADPILYGNYCWSFELSKTFTNLPVVGYDNLALYRKNKEYGQLYIHGLLNGEDHMKAKTRLVEYENPEGQYTHTLTNMMSFRRFFSISTEDVTEFTSKGAIIKGKINGYKNLKPDISYYVYVYDKDEELNAENIVKNGKSIDKKTIGDDGSFTYEYTNLPLAEDPKEYNVVVGFIYGDKLYYGPIKTLKTKGTFCPDWNHPHWIDLGLPSGTKWCCCNVGTSSPEAYGSYHLFSEGSSAPSIDQINELISYCRTDSKILNGVRGLTFIGRNGNKLFFPAAGMIMNGELDCVGCWGVYWSSTKSDKNWAYTLDCNPGYANWGQEDTRYDPKCSLRAVR